MTDTRNLIAHDADPFAAAEGRAPLRRGLPFALPRAARPVIAADAIPPRPGGMPQLPLTDQESSMDDTEANEKFALLLKFLQDKLSDADLSVVRLLFEGSSEDTLGMDRTMRLRVAKARGEFAAKQATARAAAEVERSKRFPNATRLR